MFGLFLLFSLWAVLCMYVSTMIITIFIIIIMVAGLVTLRTVSMSRQNMTDQIQTLRSLRKKKLITTIC